MFLNVSVYGLYIYMWLSLVHAWVFQHFQGMGRKGVCAGYIENRDPRAMLFFTTVWFRHSGQLQKPSGCDGFDEGCHRPIWRPPCGTSV